MTTLLPAIFGLSGTSLTEAEATMFGESQPFGYILFARNCEHPDQLTALVAELHALHPADDQPLVLIDQEGGRVARLREPHWKAAPAAGHFAQIAVSQSLEQAVEASYNASRETAQMLGVHGINVNCVPMADTRYSFSHDIIGDRAYGSDAEQIVALARAAADGLMEYGVLPVLKHLPGHGRALVDSHDSLPIVEATTHALQQDFAPFKALSDLPLGMTAHIVYTALDDQRPATMSPEVIRIIREEIGFTHLLMSDDLCMKALKGDMGERAAGCLDAGCDLALHCNGDEAEMRSVIEALNGKKRLSSDLLHALYDVLAVHRKRPAA